MKSSIFWDITLCRNMSPPSSGQKNMPSKKSAWKHAGFLLCLFFGPEDVGDMFRRNDCWLSTYYKALCTRRQNFSNTLRLTGLRWCSSPPPWHHVEAGSNTSTVALWVVGKKVKKVKLYLCLTN
jgi:hypothetical protein